MAEAAKSTASPRAEVVGGGVLRSQLGRVRGLGAAHGGTTQWLAERLTAVALVPLTLWFVVSALSLVGAPRAAVVRWASHPVNAALLIALIVATFHHAQLGLQVVIEDYVHDEKTRLAALVLMKGAAALIGLIALLAALKLAFSG